MARTIRPKAVVLVAATLLAAAMLAPARAEPPPRPRIGLALGGGGARGTAHIGVLEVLEKYHVPIDCVAGTSMGSLVAGAYLSGLQPQQMLERLGKVDWSELFFDDSARASMNFRERRLSQSYYPGLELGVTRNGLRMAHGVVGGQKIKLFFNTLVGADRGERTIESLPLPLSIIATDVGSGARVVFRSGELSAAMRASMSVPALLSPQAYKGQYLVDGGLVENLPVAEVRSRCNADVVIAVDVGSPLYKPQDVDSITAVTGQMINILTEQNAITSRGLIKAGDVYIKPNLEGISSSDFNKSRDGAERGRQAAEAQAEKLRRYALPQAEYSAWAARLKAAPQPMPRIDRIEVAGLRYVNPELVLQHIHVQPGASLDTVQLESDIAEIYGEGDFESVDYGVAGTREHPVLRITPTEKSWGPDYIRLGVALEASAKENQFALRFAYHRKWLNTLGAEWLSGLQIGELTHVYTQLYQPFDGRQRWFVSPQIGYVRTKLGIYQDDNRIAQYLQKGWTASLDVGANISTLGQVRLGRSATQIDSSVETGFNFLPTEKRIAQGWTLVADFDQADRAYFPTSGWAARGTYFKETDQGYGRLAFGMRGAYSWRDYVFNGRLSYVGAVQGKLPPSEAGALGGFLNLSGFTRDQIRAGNTRFGSIRIEKIVGKMPLPLQGDLRFGLSLEAGKAKDRFTETNLDGWLKAAAIYFGGETPIGPAYVAYGRAQGGHSTVYLFLGLP
jgi:NTE family protein